MVQLVKNCANNIMERASLFLYETCV